MIINTVKHLMCYYLVLIIKYFEINPSLVLHISYAIVILLYFFLILFGTCFCVFPK